MLLLIELIESVFSWLLKLCKWLLHALFLLPERKCIAFSLKFNYLWWWIDFFQQYNIVFELRPIFLSLSLPLLTQWKSMLKWNDVHDSLFLSQKIVERTFSRADWERITPLQCNQEKQEIYTNISFWIWLHFLFDLI